MSRSSIVASALAVSCIAYAPLSSAREGDSSQATKGFYVGGAGGQARFDDKFSIDAVDRDDTSWKAIAGWRFADQFSLEGSYVDFGDSTAPGALGVTPFAQSAKAWLLEAVGYIPIPYVDLFAKVGAARIDAEGRGATIPTSFKDKTTEFAYGWGAQWRWRSLAVRGEYERFDTDVIGDLKMVSLGVTYTLPIQSP